MWKLRRKGQPEGAHTAVAEPPKETYEEFDGTLEELRSEIEGLTEANRASRDRATERRLLRLRHLGGIRLLEDAAAAPEFAVPDFDRLTAGSPLPEFQGAAELTPGLLRAGILRDGCVLVRGLVPREDAVRFAAQIDRAFAERHSANGSATEGYYEEFQPNPDYGEPIGRPWIEQGGGLLATDSPILNFEMMEMFQAAGLPALVSGYLGEPALVSVHKTTLRKAEPAVAGAWHQDGKFMGDVRSLNLWLSLSRCGDEAPGLDIVPRRLDDFATTQTDEALLDYAVSQRVAEEVAGETPIVRPIFEPGDALFFDELFLHKTGSDPSMPNPRYAIENWFFGGAAFPGDYAPVAV